LSLCSRGHPAGPPEGWSCEWSTGLSCR